MEQDQRIYALVAAAKQGDSNAFTELYNSSYGMVYHTCYGYLKNREDAEDTTQEVFIYIYNKLADLEDNYAYYGWLKTIAVHTSINKIRARKDNASYDDAVGNEEILEGDDNLEMLPDTYVLRDEKRKIVMGIMEKELSEVQYQTLFMYYYNDFKIEQIAQIMEVSEGTVKTRLKSAKIKVKQGIEAYEQKTGDRLAINGAIPSIAMLLKASTNAVPVSVLPFAGFGIMGATGGTVAGGIAKAAAGVKVPAKAPVQAPSQMYGAQPHVPNSNPARQAANKTASSAAKGAAKGAGKGAGKGIATKVVAGIASVAILGTGTVGVMKLVDNKKDEPSKPAHKKESVETTYLEPVETDSALLEADPFNGQKFEVGGKVTFGNYEGEDISWLVLDEKDGNYLVLSEYGLEDGAFDERSIQLGDEQLYWEIFSCRTWLNGDFYNAAFDTDIQDRIVLTTVTADPNPNYSTYQGNDTQDKVFLLSVSEVQQYLGDNVDCYVTQRVSNNNNYYVSNYDGKCSWWLRTMGEDPTCAALCNSSYYSDIVIEPYDMRGRSAYSRDGKDLMIHCCFRPAMWVRPGTNVSNPEPIPTPVDTEFTYELSDYLQIVDCEVTLAMGGGTTVTAQTPQFTLANKDDQDLINEKLKNYVTSVSITPVNDHVITVGIYSSFAYGMGGYSEDYYVIDLKEGRFLSNQEIIDLTSYAGQSPESISSYAVGEYNYAVTNKANQEFYIGGDGSLFMVLGGNGDDPRPVSVETNDWSYSVYNEKTWDGHYEFITSGNNTYDYIGISSFEHDPL